MMLTTINPSTWCTLSTLLRQILLQHLFYNLLLLDQKGPHDPILHTVRTPRPSICALYGFLRLGDLGVFTGAKSGDLEAKNESAGSVARNRARKVRSPRCRACGQSVEGGLTPGSLVPQSPHFGGLPFFLVCWYWSFPPGVLTIRTLFERVLYLTGIHQRSFSERRTPKAGLSMKTYGFLRRCAPAVSIVSLQWHRRLTHVC